MGEGKEKEDLKELYDGMAEKYGEEYLNDAGRYFMDRKIATAIELGCFRRGDHLVEIGCANGAYTFEFVKLGFKITGVDLSTECVATARKRAERENVEGVDFVVADAENIKALKTNTFDGAISFSALRYVPRPQLAINEIYRLVRRDARAVVDFPNRYNPWFRYLKPWLYKSRHIHDHVYSTGEVKGFLESSGFNELMVRRILYTPKIIKPSTLRIMKVIDMVGELPLFDTFAAIIMCGGTKP